MRTVRPLAGRLIPVRMAHPTLIHCITQRFISVMHKKMALCSQGRFSVAVAASLGVILETQAGPHRAAESGLLATASGERDQSQQT